MSNKPIEASDYPIVGQGWIPEEDKPEHWSFEDKLMPLIGDYRYGSDTDGAAGDVDLRQPASAVHSQRHTSSCVAQAVVKALEIKRIQQFGPDAHVDLSRLFVYYLARELMFPSRVNKDDGTNIGIACDVLRRFGVPPETDWIWDPNKVYTPPSIMSMRNAYLHKIQAYYKIRSIGQQRVDAVKAALRAGNPVTFGTEVGVNWGLYRSYNPLRQEPLELPTIKTGRHATVLIGIKGDTFIGENSWGTEWGHDGFYFMSPDVIASDKSDDFWIVTGGWEPWEKE